MTEYPLCEVCGQAHHARADGRLRCDMHLPDKEIVPPADEPEPAHLSPDAGSPENAGGTVTPFKRRLSREDLKALAEKVRES